MVDQANAAARPNWTVRVMLIMIRGYQLTLSAFLGRQCRFVPSCSEYAAEAIRVHGALRGGWLGMKRIGRCHPWGGSGHDPVPREIVSGDRCPTEPKSGT
ncbi:MAG: membrane protein insertion efficiency factor YidD [Rhodospirillaceae bacterium]|nr:membrane protein insertion efficiency factor YidD [Rhodospirillaceae bacterium]